MTLRESRIHWFLPVLCGLLVCQPLAAQEAPAAEPAKVEKSVDEKINEFFEPATKAVNTIVFFNIYNSSEKTSDGKPVLGIPFILIWLGGSALFLTL